MNMFLYNFCMGDFQENVSAWRFTITEKPVLKIQ